MEPTDETLFLELSAKLTGVAVASGRPAKPGDLAPRNSPVPQAAAYIQLLQSWDGGVPFAKLMQKYKDMQRPITPEGIGALLADRDLGPVCRSIMKLWYLGAWYPPDRPRAASHVVSAQSYIESLVWKVMQAHPAGYSMGTFGHWADDPPPLTEFLTTEK